MRVSAGVLVAVLLGGCSATADTPTADTPQSLYIPPSPSTQKALVEGLRKAISEEKIAAPDQKIAAPIEISALRKVEYGGLGRYFVCMRELNPTSERHFVYSVFYDNDDYKGVRQSVIMEHCEAETFTRIDVPPSPSSSPSPSPKSGRRKKHD
jgi:hypothetical protein